MSSVPSKSFCVLPWIHSFVNLEGDYQLCCTSEEQDNKLYNDENEVLYFSKGVDPLQAQNSKTLRDVRLKMLRGIWPKACERCQRSEELGGSSRRLVDNQGYLDKNNRNDFLDLTNKTNSDSGIVTDVSLRWIDFRLGNICNLKCRMCSPRATVKWIEDWNKTVVDKDYLLNESDKEKFQNLNWAEEDNLIEHILQMAEEMEVLHFAGGEPMAIKKIQSLLFKLVESGHAKKIMLSFNTNITILPPAMLEAFPSFKGVKLFCSIDGHGPLNDYIRHPSKWEVIEKNMRYLDDHYEELNIETLLISTTVQAYNIMYLRPLYEFTASLKNARKLPNLVNLTWPTYLNTQILPKALKVKATNELRKIASDFAPLLLNFPDDNYLALGIESAINHMNRVDSYDREFTKFKAFTANIDEQNNSKTVTEVAPDFGDYI